MTNIAIMVTVISSLLSGLIGVVLSFYFFSRLETRKLKIDTARRLIGSRYNVHSTEFKSAFNEVIIIFSDNKEVMNAIDDFWQILQISKEQISSDAINDKLVAILKAVCKEVGLSPKELNDTYYLRVFNT